MAKAWEEVSQEWKEQYAGKDLLREIYPYICQRSGNMVCNQASVQSHTIIIPGVALRNGQSVTVYLVAGDVIPYFSEEEARCSPDFDEEWGEIHKVEISRIK